jgi:hypothetical protein
MFMGHSSVGSCSTYAGARKVYDAARKTPTGRDRTDSTWGYPLASRNGSRWVRRHGDKIIFRLYNTDVVTWLDEATVEVDNSYATRTTGSFASDWSPVQCGACGTMTTHVTPRTGDSWRERWSSALIVKGKVTFHLRDGFWHPAEDEGDAFTFKTLDRKGVRRVSAEYNLTDFEMWMSMAPQHLNLIHNGDDEHDVALALKARDFRKAACHLPLVSTANSGAFGNAEAKPLAIKTQGSGVVTGASLRRFRLWLYDMEGLMTEHVTYCMRVGEYNNLRKRMAEYEKAGVTGKTYRGMGW